jgi:FkbM family methyltransferase
LRRSSIDNQSSKWKYEVIFSIREDDSHELSGARMYATKQSLLSILKNTGIYHRLRASFVYDLYLNLTKRKLLKDRDREAAFYRDLLDGFKPGDLIFDIGAHIGDKTDTFLRLGAQVVAVDPDEHNQAILSQKFLKYGIRPKPVIIVSKAVGAKVAVETMLVCAPGSVFNTLSKKEAGFLSGAKNRPDQSLDTIEYTEKKTVETTTLDHLIEAYGLPFFIKIDVVGFELEVLQGLHRSVPCLSFEIGLPVSRQELLQCVDILGGLSSCGRFNYTWDRRNGFALDSWLEVQAFLRVLDGCGDGPIEIFWRR